MDHATSIFFMGKGGVGKSTSAALTSVFLAEKGHKVLIVSLDPAHNQADIFDTALTGRAKKIGDNLLAMEMDQDYWVRVYLKDIHKQINRTYAYLTALNLEKYFDVIKHSPGLEEYAILMAFEHIHREYGERDFLVFDMPPTALSLRFFGLPKLSLVWIEHLLALREEIIQKREIITKIRLVNKEVERDKILNKIKELKAEYHRVKEIFQDREKTQVKLVLNPDKLSFAESVRILGALKKIDMSLNQVIYNKMQPDSSCAEIEDHFAGIPMMTFPYSPTPLVGIESLRRFLKQNDELVEKQLNVCHFPG